MSLDILSYVTNGLLSSQIPSGGGGGGSIFPSENHVDNYSALPLASTATGEYYIVDNPQGAWYTFNYKQAGIYKSNGTVWTNIDGDPYLSAISDGTNVASGDPVVLSGSSGLTVTANTSTNTVNIDAETLNSSISALNTGFGEVSSINGILKCDGSGDFSNVQNSDIAPFLHSLLSEGENITLTQDSGTGVITIASSGSGGGAPAGSDGQIQFNLAGSFGACPNLIWDSSQGTFETSIIAVDEKLFVGQNSDNGSGAIAQITLSNAGNTPLLSLKGTGATGMYQGLQFSHAEANQVSFSFLTNTSDTLNNSWSFGADVQDNGGNNFFIFNQLTGSPAFIIDGGNNAYLGGDVNINYGSGFVSGGNGFIPGTGSSSQPGMQFIVGATEIITGNECALQILDVGNTYFQILGGAENHTIFEAANQSGLVLSTLASTGNEADIMITPNRSEIARFTTTSFLINTTGDDGSGAVVQCAGDIKIVDVTNSYGIVLYDTGWNQFVRYTSQNGTLTPTPI